MHSRQEIRSALVDFVAAWRGYQGTERAGAQTFLNQLITAYTGVSDPLTLGVEHERHAARDAGQGFMDLYWPDVCIVEMKGPKETLRLAEHRPQMLDYWRNCASRDQPAPRFTILCSFHRFEVWEPGRFPNTPIDVFALDELPDYVDSLMFLTGRATNPIFGGPGQKITIQASALLIDLYNRLHHRNEKDPLFSEDDLRRFIIQCTWVMLAEDLGLIPVRRFHQLLSGLRDDASARGQRSAGKEIQTFLHAMNSPSAVERSEGILAGLPYVNGGLLEQVAYIPLQLSDLADLVAASNYDWRHVNPTIFGSLFEGCLGDRRRQFGAHYTHEQDIMQIVEPTLLRPWRERMEAAKDAKTLDGILSELCPSRCSTRPAAAGTSCMSPIASYASWSSTPKTASTSSCTRRASPHS